ncbi:MAG: VWA domain-containing protein [Victivallaceae bacterium]|nr:VWA domain-containing protein [Victivallaceae bacterium]
MLEFAYKWMLFGLLAIPPVFYYVVYLRKRPSVVVASARPFKTVQARRRPTFTQICMMLALTLIVIALARPRFGNEKVVIRSNGIDMALAIDLSGSMRAFDVPRRITTSDALVKAIESGEVAERIEVAKREVKRFIDRRPNDRIGLIGFADLAYSFAPPTLDHAWLKARIDRLKTGELGETTGIASPIATGVNRLRNSDAPRRVLVLFTDGRNTAETRLTPEQAAALGKEFNVIIHTVGVGSRNAFFTVQDPFGRTRFQPTGDDFDEALLRAIAETTGGSYFHAEDADGMRRVMDEINQLEKTSFEQPKYIEFKEYAPLLSLLAAGLILLGFMAERSWRLRLP